MKVFVITFTLVFALGMLIVRMGCGDCDDLDGGCAECPVADKVEEEFAPELPLGWKVLVSRGDAGGWQQIGETDYSIADTSSELTQMMESLGFLRHQTVGDAAGGQILVQYVSASGIKVIWSLRKINESKTGFSWGRVK